MNQEKKNRLREQIRDFRYSVVAELCNPYIEKDEKLRLTKEKCGRTYEIPGSKKTSITTDTIKNWERKYRLYGKDGLFPKVREDRGRPRSIDDVEAQAIIDLLEKKPEMTASSVIKELQKRGVITRNVSRSSLSRFIDANNLKKKDRIRQKEDKQQLRFGFEHPLQCIQSDAMHGFPIPDGTGRKKKAILLVFIDDATRRILYGRFAFSEKSILFENGIHHILATFGKIGILYTDNGSTFVSNQTQRIVESLGIHLIHSRPYKPQGRGKVERFFRTVRECFLRNLNQCEIQSLEQLNHLFSKWLNLEYHRNIHSALGTTPIETWISKSGNIKKMDPFIELDKAFHHQIKRKVYTDSIVSVLGTAFQVPSILIGKKVDVTYNPNPPLLSINVSWNGKDYGEAKPVDIYANRKIKRNREFSGELDFVPDNNMSIESGVLL
ncbi:MAG: transposase [Lentisphaerae bacterium]|nr:transposase [Lentisphaerota bacterium]